MRMRVQDRVMMLICVCLLVATNAHAEETVLGKNGFARLTAGKAYVDLPSEKGVVTWFLEPYGESEHRFWGDSVEGAGGFWLPGPQGTRKGGTRIEMAFNISMNVAF